MGFVCCITVVVIVKKRKRQNVRSHNTQQVELKNIEFLNTEKITKTALSRPLPKLPNSTLTTMPQSQDYDSVYVTQPVHYPVSKCRPLATVRAYNPIVQASRQQGSNLGNLEDPFYAEPTFKNPAYAFLGAAHEELDFENVEEIYDEIK